MSRQFDEHIEDKFEHQGEQRSLVYPTSFAELVVALGVRDALQAIIDFATQEEDISNWEEVKERQNGYIQESLDSTGNFDNSVLNSTMQRRLLYGHI